MYRGDVPGDHATRARRCTEARATLPRHVHPAQHQALPACGGAVRYAVPADDNRERATCTACGTDPLREPAQRGRHGAGLGRPGAAVPPQHRAALTALDAAGRLHGARRNHRRRARCARPIEEAGAHIELQGLFTVLNVVRVGQVHLFYRARLLDTDFAPGPETIEARLFTRRRDSLGATRLSHRARNACTATSTTAAGVNSACTAPISVDARNLVDESNRSAHRTRSPP